ncbi:hypothetical protein SeLEV6574_g08408 [Synchytrium endobioticum]|uniref:Uncharacterized protein n=1 Tax=Synchytrium endobioticum TaxID=286115 RepID=A0A507C6G8_9FUNG|nr:hypothetical protein SeLEV6574_g08408 [Synchytrium endobioticum]
MHRRLIPAAATLLLITSSYASTSGLVKRDDIEDPSVHNQGLPAHDVARVDADSNLWTMLQIAHVGWVLGEFGAILNNPSFMDASVCVGTVSLLVLLALTWWLRRKCTSREISKMWSFNMHGVMFARQSLREIHKIMKPAVDPKCDTWYKIKMIPYYIKH